MNSYKHYMAGPYPYPAYSTSVDRGSGRTTTNSPASSSASGLAAQRSEIRNPTSEIQHPLSTKVLAPLRRYLRHLGVWGGPASEIFFARSTAGAVGPQRAVQPPAAPAVQQRQRSSLLFPTSKTISLQPIPAATPPTPFHPTKA